MDLNEAKEHVLEELNSTDPEQLEYLCEEVIKKVEDPEYLQVTPFRHDGGIDIRGRIGQNLYRGDFGVQVKQSNSTIGAPEVREFAGALDVDGASFGTFITTSEFTKPARLDVEETDEFSIQLISGPRLAEIMVENEIGVVQQSEEDITFAENYDFWSQFAIDESLISSKMVPQADDLEVLHYAVTGVHNGHHFKPELAEWLTEQTEQDWSRRQADYYAMAAHAVGLLDIETGQYQIRGTEQSIRKWVLSQKGEEYISAYHDDPDGADIYLYDLIDDLEIMELVIAKVTDEIAIFQDQIADLIREYTRVSGDTADRRARTIGRWIEQKDGTIKRMKRGSQIKYVSQATLGDDF